MGATGGRNRGDATLTLGWSQDHPDLKKKFIILKVILMEGNITHI